MNSLKIKLQQNSNILLEIYCYEDGNNPSYKNNILTTNNIYCIVFDTNTIIREISESYDHDNSIIKKQIIMDFPRTIININFNRCINHEILKFYLKKLKRFKYSILKNLKKIIKILLTQASFYYLIVVLQSIYLSPEQDLHVVAIPDQAIIDIIKNYKYIDIIFKKKFGLIDVKKNLIINIFDTFMTIRIHLCYDPISNKYFCKLGPAIVSWKSINK